MAQHALTTEERIDRGARNATEISAVKEQVARTAGSGPGFVVLFIRAARARTRASTCELAQTFLTLNDVEEVKEGDASTSGDHCPR